MIFLPPAQSSSPKRRPDISTRTRSSAPAPSARRWRRSAASSASTAQVRIGCRPRSFGPCADDAHSRDARRPHSQAFRRNSDPVEVVRFGRLGHRPRGFAGGEQYQPARRQRREEGWKARCRMCRRYRDAKQPCEKRAQVIVRTSHLCPLSKKPAYIGRSIPPAAATRNQFRSLDRTIWVRSKPKRPVRCWFP